jgi:hypothetical protein
LSKRVIAQNPVAGEGEDQEADPVADAGRGAQIGPERRLTVGSCPYEVKPPARVEDAGAEAGHDVAALAFERHRRHRDEEVFRQKGHQRRVIGGLVRAHELRHDRIFGGWVRGGRRFAVGGRLPSAAQAGTRPFESAVDRFDGRVQHVGHVRVESEDVAQDEDGELARWQDLKRGSRRPERWIRSVRSGLPGRVARRLHPRGGRRGMARAIQLRRAGSARAAQPRGCSTPWRVVGWPSGAC